MSFTKLSFILEGFSPSGQKYLIYITIKTYLSTVTLLLVAMDHILAKVVRPNN